MTWRVVHGNWAAELEAGLGRSSGVVRIICPYIKAGALDHILASKPAFLQVVTRYSLNDFATGVSDLAALRTLLDVGAAVRGICDLHAKAYIFGDQRAIITSANLTQAGLGHNHELGVVTEEAAAVKKCVAYFKTLWRSGGKDLIRQRIEAWERKVAAYQAGGGHGARSPGLPDFGAVAAVSHSLDGQTRLIFAEPTQAFVKFTGSAKDRRPASMSTRDSVEHSGCHRNLAYPKKKRPRSVGDGAVMFIARLTEEPAIRIYGRAIATKHQEGRDDATPNDIERRDWRKQWPHYVRVHHAQFVHGSLADGVSLHDLMKALGSDAFASTQRNRVKSTGNTNPRRAYLRQPAVELSREGFAWLNRHLQEAFDAHGTLSPEELASID